MSFEMLCMTMIGLLFGAVLIFGGYRLFIVLLPIWGFFFGLGLGAQTVQVIFGDAFLATITSWVVGFIVGIIFAILSYLFYIVAVALLSGSFGYALAVGLLTWIGLNFGFIVWAIGIVAGIIVAVLVLVLNIQKYAIIAITAFGGTAAVIYVLLASVGGLSPIQLAASPVATAISNSFWWLLFFLVVGIAGFVVQLRVNGSYEIEEYNRYSTPV
ncbi:MAG: DUF4203 domain-containing protein [Anaerolineae bacterium]|nr:DUF4203 domain-containing protein [Anaerolineae bacterium]